MVEPARAFLLDQPDDGVRQVARPRRLSDLVGHDVEGVTVLGELQHRRDEVASVRSVEPCRAHDERVGVRGTNGPFSGRLGASVGRLRGLRVLDIVRFLGAAVEDVVGRDVDELGIRGLRGSSDVERTRPIECERRGLVALSGIDGRVRSTVDDDVRRVIADDALHRLQLGDVASGGAERDDALTAAAQQRVEILTEHARASEDEPATRHRHAP